jgi:uncharacterized membrane protein
MEKHFAIIWNTIGERIAETIVTVLLFISGIILIYAGKNWAWGCFVLGAIDLIVCIILFIDVFKDIYNETVEKIIQETVERIEKSETHLSR